MFKSKEKRLTTLLIIAQAVAPETILLSSGEHDFITYQYEYCTQIDLL